MVNLNVQWPQPSWVRESRASPRFGISGVKPHGRSGRALPRRGSATGFVPELRAVGKVRLVPLESARERRPQIHALRDWDVSF